MTLNVLDKVTTPVKGIFNFLKSSIGKIGSLLGVDISAGNTLNTFMDFDATMSTVKALTNLTGGTREEIAELEELRQKARQLGADTQFSANEAAQALANMGQAGWKSAQMLGGADATLYLTGASGENMNTVSKILVEGMNSLQMSPEGFTEIIDSSGINHQVSNAMHFADVVATASANSATNVTELGQSLKYCGQLAGQMGFTIEDTALAIGLLANNGVKASSSGTALRKIFSQLATGLEVQQENGKTITIETSVDGQMRSLKDIIEDTRKAFSGMSEGQRAAIEGDLKGTAQSLGITLQDENGALKSQAQLYNEVTQSMDGLTQAGKISEAQAIAGRTAMSGLLSLVGANSESYDKLAGAIYDCNGAAKKMSETVLDNLRGDLTLLDSAIADVKIELGDKLNPYLRKFVQWITNKMPVVKKVLGNVVDFITDKIDKAKKAIEKFTKINSNLSFFDKLKIAWNAAIVQPFDEWWSSKGVAWANEKAGQIGDAIGTGLKTGILALLGVDIDKTGNEGYSIGSSFAKGFLDGFEGAKVWEAIQQKFSEMLSSAAKILPFGEKATGGSWLSAALLGYGGLKIGKGAMTLGKGVSSLAGLFTTTAAASTLTSTAATAATAGTTAAAGTAGIAGLAGAAIPALSIAGGALGVAGIVSAFNDGKKGNEGKARGMTKLGMVGAGAATGALIGGIPGALIGAGIGGIGALLTSTIWKTKDEKEAETIQKRITAEKEKQLKLYNNMQDSRAIREQLNFANDSMYATEQLYKKWNDIKWEINQGNLSEEEKLQKEYEMKSILQQLANMYPDLINASDTENQHLGAKVDLIQQMNQKEKERLRMLLLADAIESRKHRDEDIGNYKLSNDKLEGLTFQINEINDGNAQTKLGFLKQDYDNFEQQRQGAYNKTGRYDSEEYLKAESDRDFIKKQIDETLAEYGVNPEDYNINDFSTIIDALGIAQDNLFEQYKAECQNNDLLKNSLQEAYEGEIRLIEGGLGQSIDQAAASFENMDVAQKEAFLSALEKVKELNEKFNILTGTQKYVDIIVRYKTENGAGVPPPETITPDEQYATGGIVTKPHIGLVGEAGAEAIIPLTGSNKKHGISLWKQAGEYLGMFSKSEKIESIQAHAQGGIFGNISKNNILLDIPKRPINVNTEGEDEEDANTQTTNTQTFPALSQTFNVDLKNLNFSIEAKSDEENVIGTIKKNMKGIANDVAGEIAVGLQKCFANMKSNV